MTPEESDAVARALLCEWHDHRLCAPEDCAHARDLYPLALEVGSAALAARERRYAVVCLVPACRVDGRPRLLLCTDSATSATSARNSHYRMAHDGYERLGLGSVHGWVPMVKATPDGPVIG